jgi:hypothetical protein
MKTFTASKKTELEKDVAILENLKHQHFAINFLHNPAKVLLSGVGAYVYRP